jgi:hypothetical protein
MYLFGWGRRIMPLGGAGWRLCPVCMQNQQVATALEYRFLHLFWIVGFIVTRRYHFACSRCGTRVEARSPRLKKIVASGKARLIPLGPVFCVVLGGALLLVGPGDYSD